MTKHVWIGAASASALYAIRRVSRNWGATKEEATAAMPGDQLIPDPVFQTTAAITVSAGPSAVWAALVAELIADGATNKCLNRGDNIRFLPLWGLGGISADATVVDLDPGRALVLSVGTPSAPTDCVVTTAERWDGSTRVVLRIRTGLCHPGQIFVRELAAPLLGLSAHHLLGAVAARTQQMPASRAAAGQS